MIKESPHRELSAISLGHMALRLAASMGDDISHLLRPLLLLLLIFPLESDFLSKIETKPFEYQAKSSVHENLLKGY